MSILFFWLTIPNIDYVHYTNLQINNKYKAFFFSLQGLYTKDMKKLCYFMHYKYFSISPILNADVHIRHVILHDECVALIFSDQALLFWFFCTQINRSDQSDDCIW